RITVYGKLAEICQQYLKKGSRAYFEGRLRTREWEKDGVKRYTTEIIANDMMMLDRASDNMGSYSAPAAMMNNQNAAPMQAAPMQSAPMQSAPMGGMPPQGYQQAPQMAPKPVPQQAAPQAAPGGYQQAPQQQPYQGGYQQPQGMPQAAPQPGNNFDDFDDDIPF